MKRFRIIIKTKNKNYPIIIGENILGKTGNLINTQIPSCKKIALIIDSKVPKKNLVKVKNSIKNFDCKIVMQSDEGFGNALIQGIKEVETNFLCIFNADGSMDPKYLKNMINELSNNCDFVFNSRYEKEGGSDDDTFLTYIGNKIMTFICNLFFRLDISDVLFTYVMGKTSAFKSLDLKRKDFRFCIELPVLAKFKKYKFISKPSYERSRLSGRKKVNELKDGFLILSCILTMFIFRK